MLGEQVGDIPPQGAHSGAGIVAVDCEAGTPAVSDG